MVTKPREGLPAPRRAPALRRPAPLALSAVLALAVFGAPGAVAQTPSSTSFVLGQSTVSAAGVSAASTSFVLDGSAAQPATVGETTSATYVLQSGFWTSLSTQLLLRVEGTGTGGGTVTAAGIACDLNAGVATGDCTEKLTHGESITLVAVPDPANQFDGWAGCDGTATTNETDDTCLATLTAGRTLTASFTLLGTLGDRVWRDVDGDGIQGPGEPGLDGVAVTIGGGGFSSSSITGGGGLYGFIDVPPGTHTVAVDTATLPAGVVPTFDADGTATPHAAQVTLAPGEDVTTADFGYQPRVDLAIAKEDSADPLPGGDDLVYTITVANLGPGAATGVVVVDDLPAGTTLVATSGCAEDPAGVPTCSLGDLGVGATASYTVEVSIDPAPPRSITNTATVTAVEADVDLSNDTASQSTELDDAAPTVVLVDSDQSTADGELTDCETVHARPVHRLLVRFSESMLDAAGGAGPGDVTNLASWSLVAAGPDAELETAGCGPVEGDDQAISFEAITYDAATDTAALALPSGTRLAPSLYRLFACGTGGSVLTDLAGNPLDGDGDGSAGGDFLRFFRTDPENLFADGHFDCDLGAWIPLSTNPSEVFHAEDDVDGSADSGSAGIANLTASTEFALGQCQPAEPGVEYHLSGRVRMDAEAGGVGVSLSCEFFDGAGCGGTSLGVAPTTTTLLGDTGAQWVAIHDRVASPEGTASVLCAVDLLDGAADGFEARLDRFRLDDGVIFVDGFETGDTLAWSASVGEE